MAILDNLENISSVDGDIPREGLTRLSDFLVYTGYERDVVDRLEIKDIES